MKAGNIKSRLLQNEKMAFSFSPLQIVILFSILLHTQQQEFVQDCNVVELNVCPCAGPTQVNNLQRNSVFTAKEDSFSVAHNSVSSSKNMNHIDKNGFLQKSCDGLSLQVVEASRELTRTLQQYYCLEITVDFAHCAQRNGGDYQRVGLVQQLQFVTWYTHWWLFDSSIIVLVI